MHPPAPTLLREQRYRLAFPRGWGLGLAESQGANSPGEQAVGCLARGSDLVSPPQPLSSKRHTEQGSRASGEHPIALGHGQAMVQID